jgi:hypothetical protein
LHSKSQYTTVKQSRQLFEHTYTSDPHGPGTLTPIEFFQQDLLWQSSITHSNSCSIKLPNTSRDNPSSGYRSSCTPQRHFGVYSIITLQFTSHDDRLPHSNDSHTRLTKSIEVRRRTLLWKSTTSCLHCYMTM